MGRNLLLLLHTMVLLGTVFSQATCHGVIDGNLCETLYDADPDTFCDNE